MQKTIQIDRHIFRNGCMLPELTRMRNTPLQQKSNRGFYLPESDFDFRPFLRRGGIILSASRLLHIYIFQAWKIKPLVYGQIKRLTNRNIAQHIVNDADH